MEFAITGASFSSLTEPLYKHDITELIAINPTSCSRRDTLRTELEPEGDKIGFPVWWRPPCRVSGRVNRRSYCSVAPGVNDRSAAAVVS